jgi:hypothetical protein
MGKLPEVSVYFLLIGYIAVSCTFMTYLYLRHDGMNITGNLLLVIFMGWFVVWQLIVALVGPPWGNDKL